MHMLRTPVQQTYVSVGAPGAVVALHLASPQEQLHPARGATHILDLEMDQLGQVHTC